METAPAAGTDVGDGPQRRCIVTRRAGSREGLIRFAISPEGEVVPDVAERLPGRGLWVTAQADILGRACAENSFAKAARRKVRVPADLPERLPGLIDQRCMALIGLARRSGAAVAGYEKARAMVERGAAAVLLEASDGARDGREKLLRGARSARVVALWTAAQLGAPFGRDRVVHVAIEAGGVCERLVREVERLEGLRGSGAAPAGSRALQES